MGMTRLCTLNICEANIGRGGCLFVVCTGVHLLGDQLMWAPRIVDAFLWAPK